MVEYGFGDLGLVVDCIVWFVFVGDVVLVIVIIVIWVYCCN